MDESFITFMQEYNLYTKKENMEKISPFKVDRHLTEHFDNDRSNLYDKLMFLFPTIEKFIYDNMFLIHLNGVQKPICKNTRCTICNHTFEMSKVASLVDDNIVHKSCTKTNKQHVIKKVIEEMFSSNNVCGMCNEQINETPLMCDNLFFHKDCCINATIESYKHLKCFMCDKPINPEKKHIEYYTRYDKTLHVSCAKELDRTIKFKKVKINLSVIKCCICGYYTSDNKHVHTICQNKLKSV